MSATGGRGVSPTRQSSNIPAVLHWKQMTHATAECWLADKWAGTEQQQSSLGMGKLRKNLKDHKTKHEKHRHLSTLCVPTWLFFTAHGPTPAWAERPMDRLEHKLHTTPIWRQQTGSERSRPARPQYHLQGVQARRDTRKELSGFYKCAEGVHLLMRSDPISENRTFLDVTEQIFYVTQSWLLFTCCSASCPRCKARSLL